MRPWLALSACVAVAASSGGCATTRTTPSTTATTRVNRSPSCRTGARLLAPATRSPGPAAIAKGGLGWVLVWTEKAGNREALRFHVVDKLGAPRSPSVEVVDRDTHLADLGVRAEGDGYLVSWGEGAARFERKLDARNRPSGDVNPGETPMATAGPSRCVAAGDKLACVTSEGRRLELPGTAHVVAEQVDDGGEAVIASDGEGLRLFVLDCAAR